MSEEVKPAITEEDVAKATRNEAARLMTVLLSKRAQMAADYKNTIKHTGGLLTNSMVYAYARGLDDAFKLLNTKKEENNEESVQK